MDANLYVGFGYITDKDLGEIGSTENPGVAYTDSRTGAVVCPSLYFAELLGRRKRGLPAIGGRYKQSFPDESRRFYYVHNSIHGEYRKLEKDGEAFVQSLLT
jgi:hypothetical protein